MQIPARRARKALVYAKTRERPNPQPKLLSESYSYVLGAPESAYRWLTALRRALRRRTLRERDCGPVQYVEKIKMSAAAALAAFTDLSYLFYLYIRRGRLSPFCFASSLLALLAISLLTCSLNRRQIISLYSVGYPLRFYSSLFGFLSMFHIQFTTSSLRLNLSRSHWRNSNKLNMSDHSKMNQ